MKGELHIVWWDPVSTIKLDPWQFQTFPDVSLFKKLIGKSNRPQNSTSVYGQAQGYPVRYEIKRYRLAKIQYCYMYSETDSEVCKKNRSVALCRVFDLKFNRIHLAQVIIKLCVVYGQHFIDVGENEPRCELFLYRQEQRVYKVRFIHVWVKKYHGMSARRDSICFHWNADYLLENITHKNAKMMFTSHQSILMMSALEYILYLLLEAECSSIEWSSCPYTNFL